MLNSFNKNNEDFERKILEAAENGSPKIEVKDKEEYMKKIFDLYTQINLYLKFLDVFDIKNVEASYLVEDTKTHTVSSRLYYDTHKPSITSMNYSIVDFDKVLNDAVLTIIIDRYNSYIKEIQNKDSELYQEIKSRTKKSVLYLLKQASIKYAIRGSKFVLDEMKETESTVIVKERIYYIDLIKGKDKILGTEPMKKLKIKKPNLLRDEDFKDIVLKSIKRINLLMK